MCRNRHDHVSGYKAKHLYAGDCLDLISPEIIDKIDMEVNKNPQL